MREVALFTVGKLKDPHLLALENEYLKRITSFNFNIIESKAYEEDVIKEGVGLLKKIQEIFKDKNPLIVLLTEKGKTFDSKAFSEWFYRGLLITPRPICFVIGGAAGFSPQLHTLAEQKLSISALTFPHLLARILLIEQLFRAETIHKGHPYHK